jgi:hypothetical protein
MDVDEVRERLREIDNLRGDDERQHAEEDDLHHDVLSAIANGEAADPRRLADEALRSGEIRFSRWYA